MEILSRGSSITKWLLLSLVVLSFSVLSSLVATCNALPKAWEDSLRREIKIIARQQPRYVWGGSESEARGLDCSGYIFLAAKRAGIPGITRTTAINMAKGYCGWTGKDIEIDNAMELDIPFWTWADKPDRPFGHVGMFILGDNGLLSVTHASMTFGHIVIVPLKGKLLTDLSLIKRLTIGDKK